MRTLCEMELGSVNSCKPLPRCAPENIFRQHDSAKIDALTHFFIKYGPLVNDTLPDHMGSLLEEADLSLEAKTEKNAAKFRGTATFF